LDEDGEDRNDKKINRMIDAKLRSIFDLTLFCMNDLGSQFLACFSLVSRGLAGLMNYGPKPRIPFGIVFCTIDSRQVGWVLILYRSNLLLLLLGPLLLPSSMMVSTEK